MVTSLAYGDVISYPSTTWFSLKMSELRLFKHKSEIFTPESKVKKTKQTPYFNAVMEKDSAINISIINFVYT